MTAPRFNILTQKELTIDLSRPAMAVIIHAIETREPMPLRPEVQCEIDNFVNCLLNLIERGVDEVSDPVLSSSPEPGNLDLIGG